MNYGWLVLSTNPSEKWWSESQLGWLYIPHIWWKNKNHVPNHQPVNGWTMVGTIHIPFVKYEWLNQYILVFLLIEFRILVDTQHMMKIVVIDGHYLPMSNTAEKSSINGGFSGNHVWLLLGNWDISNIFKNLEFHIVSLFILGIHMGISSKLIEILDFTIFLDQAVGESPLGVWIGDVSHANDQFGTVFPKVLKLICHLPGLVN